LYLNWRLTVVTLLLLASFGGLLALGLAWMRSVFRDRAEAQSEVTSALMGTLGGIRTVKAYGAEQREERVFTGALHRLLRFNARTVTIGAAIAALWALTLGAVSVTVTLVGGASIRGGGMSMGDLVMYLAFLAMLMMPVVQLASVGAQITES